MNIIVVRDFSKMSTKAAEMIINRVKQNPAITLGLATGGTPLGIYQQLIQNYEQNHTSYQNVTTFNLDEYVGLSRDDPNSYFSYMNKNLFNHIDIRKEDTNIPNGEAENFDAECFRYEQLINNIGGIDLQLLGVGTNGHIGFNEPYTDFLATTHVVELAESTRQENAKYFSDPKNIPTLAITMGIRTIMRAKEILLVVSGKRKASILFEVIKGKTNKKIPATVLKSHPNVTIIADVEAYSEIEMDERSHCNA